MLYGYLNKYFPEVVEKIRSWQIYLTARYFALSEQEQHIVRWVGVVCAIGILYGFIWQPLAHRAEEAKQNYERQAELVRWIQSNEATFKALMPLVAASDGHLGRSIISIVTETAQTQGIALSRFEPKDQQVRVWLEQVSFNQLVDWLDQLNKAQHIQVAEIKIESQAANGLVNVTLVLK